MLTKLGTSVLHVADKRAPLMRTIAESGPTVESSPRASLRPALIVPLIVATIVLGGGLLAIFSARSARTVGGSGGAISAPTHLVEQGVHLDPAQTLLQRTEQSALIPEDVISSLYLPNRARLVRVIDLDNGNGPFDRQIDVTSAVAPAQLVTAYTTLLEQYGWTLSSTKAVAGPSRSTGTELLSQRASRDGYNWEVGITLTNNTLAIAPSQRNANASQRSFISMRLLQVPQGN
ncbi:MAG TPA: hypothetical protein VMU99_07570 [Acidimicrobiales bacterium]|nr:hypothetical protein [Acidimicrobiales bacterium]